MTKETATVREPELTETLRKRIDAMTQIEMATLYRRSPAGHPLFAGKVGEYFLESFRKKGGMTPEISKAVGW